jgi:hypothetical protein
MNSLRNNPERVGLWVTLHVRICEVLGLNLGWDTDDFQGFRKFFQANGGIAVPR